MELYDTYRLFNISSLQENNAQFTIIFIMATLILVPSAAILLASAVD